MLIRVSLCQHQARSAFISLVLFLTALTTAPVPACRAPVLSFIHILTFYLARLTILSTDEKPGTVVAEGYMTDSSPPGGGSQIPHPAHLSQSLTQRPGSEGSELLLIEKCHDPAAQPLLVPAPGSGKLRPGFPSPHLLICIQPTCTALLWVHV